MLYYPHDSNMFQDETVTELYARYGYEGLGLYYTVLEKLALHEKPMKTVVLKKQCDVAKKLEKVWVYMEEIGLISSENGQTFSVRINSYIETFKKNREKIRNRVSQHRENKADKENVTRYCKKCNAPNGKCKCNGNNRDTNVSPEGGGDPAEPENSPVDDQPDDKPFKVKRDRAGKMIRPTLELLTAYVMTLEGGTKAMALEMFEYYGSKDWKMTKTPITNWNLAASRWVRKNKPGGEYGPVDDADDPASSPHGKSKSSFI